MSCHPAIHQARAVLADWQRAANNTTHHTSVSRPTLSTSTATLELGMSCVLDFVESDSVLVLPEDSGDPTVRKWR